MSTRFRRYYPEQDFLLPPSPSEWLAEGHLAYFIFGILAHRLGEMQAGSLSRVLPKTIQPAFAEGCTGTAPAAVEVNAGAFGIMNHASK